MQILDTDTLSYLFNNHPRVLQRLKDTNDVTVITIINRVELLKGRIDYLLKAQTGNDILRAQILLGRTEVFLSRLPILYFNKKSVDIFQEFSLRSNYRKLGRADLLISSIALANNATLITRNTKDFSKIKQLNLENWID
jgi:tRNA(fMet)-specific endonuclease VapC